MLFAQEAWGLDHLAQMRVCRNPLLKQHFALILDANVLIFQNDQEGSTKTLFLSCNASCDAILLC